MPTLLEKALEKVNALPPDEHEAIASEILASLGTKPPGRHASAKNATSFAACLAKQSKKTTEVKRWH